ncbi:POK18 protein, partial [Edolisoma coerulescens]|nr:POK18 protein [Edolisoma coerulescens]
WKYLGMTLTDTCVHPQKLTINTDIRTLHDVQILAGDIQWVRNVCGITNEDLEPLFSLMQGGRAPQDV